MVTRTLAILCGAVLAASSAGAIEIREVEKGGRKTIEFENEFYKMVLVPEIARLPLSYFFKVTGHHLLIPDNHPPNTVSLETPNKGFVYYGGLIDSIPWVSGRDAQGRELPVKGYLYSLPWNCATGRTDKTAWFLGSTTVEYPDPVSGEKTTLFFQKKVTGYAASARVTMDYLIRNAGKTRARMTFDAHARTGVAEYDAGDYFQAPGRECYVYELVNRPDVLRRGIQLDTWTPWPVQEAAELIPEKATRYMMVYLPADWCLAGDEKYKETLFFTASPVKIGSRTDIMKMGIFMTTAAYVVQPCLSYSLQSHPDRWERPGETVLLQPGEECAFTLTLTPYQGISRSETADLYAVYPGAVLVRKPELTESKDGFAVTGRAAFSGKGKLALKTARAALAEKEVGPGVVDLSTLGTFKREKSEDISMTYADGSGTTDLMTFPAPAPWKKGWTYRRALTVDRRRVIESDVAGFPMLVDLTDPSLRAAAHGGKVSDATGGDIAFTAADGETPLAHELERYDPATGALRCWVRVPALTRSADTLLYVYYGGKPPKTEPATDVWDEGYAAVLHFAGQGKQAPDSTRNGNRALASSEAAWVSDGAIGSSCRLSGPASAFGLPDSLGRKLDGVLTVEAWVNSSRNQAERIQTILSKWSPLENLDTFDAYDAGATQGLDARGFLGAVFDGRYVYFSPENNTSGRAGIALRYDTQKDFHAAGAWTAYDAEKTSGLVTKGYYGAVYDGRYIYYAPRVDGTAYHTRAMRFDTTGDFRDSRFWEAYDVGLGTSYQSGAFDGRYVYFCPGTGNVGGRSGLVLRYDTREPFAAKESWKTYDASKTDGVEARDFDGAVFDGRYLYFVPLSFNAVLRLDTTGDFEKPGSWAAFDAGKFGMKRCVGGVFDGTYVYFAAYANNWMVRHDPRRDFRDPASWASYDVTLTRGLKHYGYDGAFTDGRYVYFVPFMEDEKGKGFHSDVLRYDPQGAFDDPASWRAHDAGDTAGLRTVGYNGGAFDGRYFYFAPWHDGVAYEKDGTIVGHGRVLRYDTVGRNGSFILKYTDCGHNGGLCGAVRGPTFTINTERGPVTARDNKVPAPGWHHIAGVYDGAVVKLFVDGTLVDQQAAEGALVQNDVAVTIGRIAGGLGCFEGLLDELRISRAARSDAWVKTSYANQRDPKAFCRAGAEETAP